MPHEILPGFPPKETDIAIVSIDSRGNLGELNQYVLVQYGYDETDLPKEDDLKYGFGTTSGTKGKPIIFVVTVDGRQNTEDLLAKNLYNALTEFRGWFRDRILWLPLMGTGTGRLSLQKSYEITAKALNRFYDNYPEEFTLIISLPNTASARVFRNSLVHSNFQESTEEFLQKLNSKFYLAGASWEGEDQVERFLEERIWEKGHADNSYSDVIYSIKENDIIILKSAFSHKGESILRVKAIGVVTKESNDGGLIHVDWRIKDLGIDIPILGKYRRTISQVFFEDVVTIFSYLDTALWQKLSPLQKTSLIGENKIVGLISDSEKGSDYLEIDKDVRAFARVIAAKSFEPPLAIALLGKWGSGKSFFMRKLKEQIEDFSLREENDMYCKGVVHIHFNAWSYMDANLWASFVSKIFEGLQEYIKNEKLSLQKLNSIKKLLTNELNVTKTNIDVLEEKKGAIKKQIETLEKKRIVAKRKVEENINRLRKQTAWDVLYEIDQQFRVKDKIIAEFEENHTYVKTREQIKEIVPEEYWNNPETAYKQAKSKYTFLKEFFKRKNIEKNLRWLALIFFLILVIPIGLELFGISIKNINFSISQAALSFLVTLGFIWKRAEVVYKKLQPVVASFWKIKVTYEQLKDEALAKFEQEEKVLKLEIEKGEEEVLMFTQQIQKAEVIAAELSYKIDNALASETLYSFIDERSKSEDYKKHLGIISTIRKDFEILNGLFLGHNSEIISQGKAEKFKEYFKKPVERIILYIDDLDRCPEENVVQVLEAVNLLMAFPLFVVIVGVDPRWVKNALIKKYALQFTGTLNGEAKSKSEIEQIEPSSYLEKIFQILFHLKNAQPQNVKNMIRQLATTKPLSSVDNSPTMLPGIDYPEIDFDNADVQTIDTAELSIDTDDVIDESEINITENIEFLELSEKEIQALEDMGEIIGSNPRAIKRFVNIFKIVKAHEDYTLNTIDTQEELLAILFLLALSTGQFKCLVQSFENYIQDPIKEDSRMTFYLQQFDNSYDKEKKELYLILSENTNYYILQNIKAGIFKTHNEFIKRFTFKNI